MWFPYLCIHGQLYESQFSCCTETELRNILLQFLSQKYPEIYFYRTFLPPHQSPITQKQIFTQLHWPFPGLQLRKIEKNGFHDNFLISQPNPMMLHSLESSRRDDSNEWWDHRVWLRNEKVSILKTINFRLYLLHW